MSVLGSEIRRPVPLPVRAALARRSRGHCETCGEKRELEIHHLRLFVPMDEANGGGPIFGLETERDVELLCSDCHRAAHLDPNGEYWEDPEEMRIYWETFPDD